MAGIAGEGINTDAGNEQEALFSLAALKGKGSLADLAEVAAPAEHEMEEYEADSDGNAAQPGEQDSDDAEDSDEEDRYAFVSVHLPCDLLLPWKAMPLQEC